MARIGRNEPCPCGSGRKFKVCCGVASQGAGTGDREGSATLGEVGWTGPTGGRFRFEAGSYGGAGGYLPSIACLARDRQGKWAYHFVLVIPDALRDDAEAATIESGEHLFDAFEGGPVPEAVVRRLKNVGYVSVTDFRVVGAGSRRGQGFVPGVDEYD